jgi:hypothetical protein
VGSAEASGLSTSVNRMPRGRSQKRRRSPEVAMSEPAARDAFSVSQEFRARLNIGVDAALYF